jgi:hypothetical protein
MSKFLFEVQQKNRLEQKGLLQRFSITCYGHQESVEEMRSSKADKYKELKQTKNKKEMEEWFLNYKPEQKYTPDLTKSVSKKMKKSKTKKVKKTKKKKSANILFNIYGKKSRKNKKSLY